MRAPEPPWPRLAPEDASRPALDAGDIQLWWWPESAMPELPRRERIGQLLRRTLAPCLGVAPEALAFGREPRGRPFLAHADAPDFNLTDTGGGTLVAVSRAGRVGVDIERHDRRVRAAALARRWFSADEAAAVAALPDEAASRLFLHLWTAKEAACKATGTGIFDNRLAQWRFAPAEGDPQVRALPPEAGGMAAWRFLRLAPTAAHTAVVALRGDARALHAFHALYRGPWPSR
ncbi:4'-phosphopantetheinyl transferase family protein [Coralloluteibacterium thermophilus]|uniref:4'-phosphopantetheinyl transferase family protein n=1 Tax=Coralloluteibacterium thermophilum TaxID=2707049 RepID=A0ABV9NQ12_9GAMM